MHWLQCLPFQVHIGLCDLRRVVSTLQVSHGRNCRVGVKSGWHNPCKVPGTVPGLVEVPVTAVCL